MPTAPVTKVAEFYGLPTFRSADWRSVAAAEQCPFIGRKCLKNRKSEPSISIGTCTMVYREMPVMICPFRLLERSQIFIDCIHLLGRHEPGNELRVVAELSVPGGSIDYCVVSVRDGKPRDFVGIELQTLDSTGTVWPDRQRFLKQHGVVVRRKDANAIKSFGMNWKMTAKTILVQLNHKIETFEHMGKQLVLVLQDSLLNYIRGTFAFNHIAGQRDGDPMQFHSYELRRDSTGYSLRLKERLSTDAAGVAACLGLQLSARVELATLLQQIETKLPQSTLLTVSGGQAAPPVPEAAGEEG
jgi:hypothetical protein